MKCQRVSEHGGYQPTKAESQRKDSSGLIQIEKIPTGYGDGGNIMLYSITNNGIIRLSFIKPHEQKHE